MAITLQIEDYCQNCDRFEAEVHQTKVIGEHPFYGPSVIINTEVVCSGAQQCARLYDHLREQIRKEHAK